MMAGFLLEIRMNMTVEMYEQAVAKAMKEVALFHQKPIRPSIEKLPVDRLFHS